jgi:alpha-amylase
MIPAVGHQRLLSRVLVALILGGLLWLAPLASRGSDEGSLPVPDWKGKVGVMLQGFHWNSAAHTGKRGGRAFWWDLVAKKSRTIGKHFDAVWLPPVSRAAVEDKHGPFAQGYLPYSLQDLNSDYGSEDKLRRALGKLNAKGVKPLADVVLNHISATPQVRNTPERFQLREDHRFNDLTAEDIVRESGGRGQPDTGQQFPLVADVDHRSAHTRQVYGGFLQRLQQAGFKGVRYDFAKGYSPSVIGDYNQRLRPDFSVTELWEDVNGVDNHRRSLLGYVQRTGYRTAVFDFTTKAVLQEAIPRGEYWRLVSRASPDGRIEDGRPAGLIGLAPNYAVTFVDNHDTGSSPGGNGQGGQKHWEFSGRDVMQGYAYVLTHPGIPCVYWPHYFDWTSPFQQHPMKREIDRLIGLRRQQGIGSDSTVRVLAADREKYAAIVDGRLAMKIGPGQWSPPGADGQWKLAAQGLNYQVWTLAAGVARR